MEIVRGRGLRPQEEAWLTCASPSLKILLEWSELRLETVSFYRWKGYLQITLITFWQPTQMQDILNNTKRPNDTKTKTIVPKASLGVHSRAESDWKSPVRGGWKLCFAVLCWHGRLSVCAGRSLLFSLKSFDLPLCHHFRHFIPFLEHSLALVTRTHKNTHTHTTCTPPHTHTHTHKHTTLHVRWR